MLSSRGLMALLIVLFYWKMLEIALGFKKTSWTAGFNLRRYLIISNSCWCPDQRHHV